MQDIQTIRRQIDAVQKVLTDWGNREEAVTRVRGLEKPTQRTPQAERAGGYYPSEAVPAYHLLLKAFELSDTDMTDQERAKLRKVMHALDSIEPECRDRSLPSFNVNEITAQKFDELRDNGKVYIASGHRKHFNVIKIAAASNGYTLTLYDAGHESEIVKIKDKRAVIHAFVEKPIKPGTDIKQLIRTFVAKPQYPADSEQYRALKSIIDNAQESQIIRAMPEFAQRKGNCTTRGLRILMKEILGNDPLSDKIYNFIAGTDDGNLYDIRSRLHRRIEDLRYDLHIANILTSTQLTMIEAVLDPDNYEIMKRDGQVFWRTKVGLIHKECLEDMAKAANQVGLPAYIRESTAYPGHYYLGVDINDHEQADNYPAIMSYALKRFYEDAQKQKPLLSRLFDMAALAARKMGFGDAFAAMQTARTPEHQPRL
jgi:hypothetical protein